MTIKVGSVYNVKFKSGNTHSAFSWPDKIPDSGNKYMKNKVIKVTKKLNPNDSLDYDYVVNIYDKIDGAIEMRNIKVVSEQLIFTSSTFRIAGSKKKTAKKRKYKRTKKRTKKRRMKGGTIEQRMDSDGKYYTKAQFIEFYDDLAEDMWASASGSVKYDTKNTAKNKAKNKAKKKAKEEEKAKADKAQDEFMGKHFRKDVDAALYEPKAT